MTGRAAILAAGVLWSLSGLFIKGFDLPAMTIAFYRSFFAGIAFLPWVLRVGVGSGSAFKGAAVASYVLVVSLFVLANKLTTSANAIVLQYTAPLFVMVWSAWFLREKIRPANLACLAVASLGMGVIVAGGRGTPDMAGIWVAVASGVAFSGYMMFQRKLGEEPPERLVVLYNLATAACLLPWVWDGWRLTGGQLAGLIAMGVVQLGMPYALFAKGLQTVRPQEAALITLVEPVLNPVWVYLAWGEVPSQATLAGGGAILAALAARFVFFR